MNLVKADCVEAMRETPAASIDAIVTDPPYGLEFMGRDWDAPWKTGDGFRRSRNENDVGRSNAFGRTSRTSPEYRAGLGFQAWTEQWAREAYRVLKPGGYLLAFAGTRTYHRMASGVEDAGFEIRDCIAWMYGSGFPKSLDVSKAIDAKAGAERAVTREASKPLRSGEVIGFDQRASTERERRDDPVTAAAAAWQGWGTALKPAFEPVVVARKPLIGTVAANVLAHGTGALNIDACRIGDDEICAHGGGVNGEGRTYGMGAGIPALEAGANPHVGRWPANVILDADAAAILDEQSGESASTIGKPRAGKSGDGWGMTATGAEYGDSGGASRFFYVAKASRSERNAGLDGFEKGEVHRYGAGIGGSETSRMVGAPDRNVHPTVKPIDLMRHLVRLVTPPGGTVLDPFMGSGTTGCACALEHFDFVGIDRDDDGTYLPIAEARIAFWREHGEDGWRIVRERDAADARREKVEESGQLSILEVETEDEAEEVAA